MKKRLPKGFGYQEVPVASGLETRNFELLIGAELKEADRTWCMDNGQKVVGGALPDPSNKVHWIKPKR